MYTVKQKYLFINSSCFTNKANGMKNLGCFPCCFQHNEKSFCGQCVRVKLFLPTRYVRMFEDKQLLIVGHLQGVEHKGSSLKKFVDGRISRKFLEENCFSSEIKSGMRFHVGQKVLEEWTSTDGEFNVSEFIFNGNPKGWQYDWDSNRKIACTSHAFVVSILQISSDDSECMDVIGQFPSTKFKVTMNLRLYVNLRCFF